MNTPIAMETLEAWTPKLQDMFCAWLGRKFPKESSMGIIALGDAYRAGRIDLITESQAAELQKNLTPADMAAHPTRIAIINAIADGRMGINRPPTEGHWLMSYWKLGQEASADCAAVPHVPVKLNNSDKLSDGERETMLRQAVVKAAGWFDNKGMFHEANAMRKVVDATVPQMPATPITAISTELESSPQVPAVKIKSYLSGQHVDAVNNVLTLFALMMDNKVSHDSASKEILEKACISLKALGIAATTPQVPTTQVQVPKWQDQLQAAYPKSEPEHWSNGLVVSYMAEEIGALRAALAAEPQMQATNAHYEEQPDGSVQAVDPADYASGQQVPVKEDSQWEKHYCWMRDWYLRDGKRAEINPDGHICITTPEIVDRNIAAAIAAAKDKP